MSYTYHTHGTCSRQITFDLDEEGKVRNVKFLGGCNGNLQGIAALVEGQPAEDVIQKLRGINCNGKGTSCRISWQKPLTKFCKILQKEQVYVQIEEQRPATGI